MYNTQNRRYLVHLLICQRYKIVDTRSTLCGSFKRAYHPVGVITEENILSVGHEVPNENLLDIRSNEVLLFEKLRSRFIQRLSFGGKKSSATKVFDESLDILYQQYKEAQKSDPKLIPQTKSDLFLTAIHRAKPWLTTKTYKRGGKPVVIPEMLTESQSLAMAIRWLIQNSQSLTSSGGKSTSYHLANELFGCLTNQGKTITQREQIHKLAEANRAWIL